MTDTTNPVVTQLAALTVEARRIADALTAPLPGEDGLPVSTCPRTDRHGYHMWADADRTAICPGHPAPEAARTTSDNPAASNDTAACDNTTSHPAHRYMQWGQVHQCPGVEAVFAVRNCRMEQLRHELDAAHRMLDPEDVHLVDEMLGTVSARDAELRETRAERDKALKAFNAVTLELEDAKAINAEACQLIDMQKELIGTERRIVMTAMSHREDEGARIEHCDHCGRDHMGELDEAIQAADVSFAKAFPASTDGPRRPGRLPDEGPQAPAGELETDAALAEWRSAAKSALKEVEQQTARADDAEVTIARVRDLTGRWAKRTDQLKRAAELLDDAIDGPQADHA